MLVIDPRIRQDASHKKTAAAQKPVLQRLFVSAAFYKRLKNLSAVLIHVERKFGGCHCTAQTNLLSGRHTASVSPSSETAIAASPGASVHTSL